MEYKKILVWAVIGLFVLSGIGMFFSDEKETSNPVTKEIPSDQKGETQAEMMERMHPSSKSKTDGLNNNMKQLLFTQIKGKSVPDFTLSDQDGSFFKLSDYKDKTVVLFFSGGAMCYPACWDQISALGLDKRFNNKDVVTASIVVDSKEKWDKIIASQPKYGNGIILFDTDKSVSRAYDMLDAPSSMHKGSFPGHTYLVIKNGVVTYMLDDPRMAMNTDEVASNL